MKHYLDHLDYASANDLRILSEQRAREQLVLREAQRQARSREAHPSQDEAA